MMCWLALFRYPNLLNWISSLETYEECNKDGIVFALCGAIFKTRVSSTSDSSHLTFSQMAFERVFSEIRRISRATIFFLVANLELRAPSDHIAYRYKKRLHANHSMPKTIGRKWCKIDERSTVLLDHNT